MFGDPRSHCRGGVMTGSWSWVPSRQHDRARPSVGQQVHLQQPLQGPRLVSVRASPKGRGSSHPPALPALAL